MEAWVKKIPAFLHLAHITSGGDDVEDLPEFQVLFHWQQRLLPFPSIELDRFLLILQVLPSTYTNILSQLHVVDSTNQDRAQPVLRVSMT